MATLIKIDRNGSKHYEGLVTCDRCGGAGASEAWKYTGLTCYKCGGTGKVHGKWIERTPEYQAKLDARRAAKAEAKAAQYRKEHEEEMRKAAEEQAAKEAEEARIKAISQHQGEVGQKITVDIVESHTATFETHFGYRTQTMHIHIMKDADGNVYTWKTQNSLGYYLDKKLDDHNYLGDWHSIEEDEAFIIAGTIKEHSEYRDEKQTVLTRCKIIRKEGE